MATSQGSGDKEMAIVNNRVGELKKIVEEGVAENPEFGFLKTFQIDTPEQLTIAANFFVQYNATESKFWDNHLDDDNFMGQFTYFRGVSFRECFRFKSAIKFTFSKNLEAYLACVNSTVGKKYLLGAPEIRYMSERMKRWRDVLLSTDKTVKLPDHLGATWLRLAIECGKNLFEAAEKVGFKQHAEEIHSDKNCRCAERMAVQAMHPRGSFCAPEMGK